MLVVRRVQGHSMQPSLRPGQIVVFSTHPDYRLGSVVLAHHYGREVVKRLVDLGGQAQLRGDNQHPAHNLVVPHQALIGRLIWPRL